MTDGTCPVCRGTSLDILGSHRSDYRGIEYTLRGCETCATWHWTPLEHPAADYYEGDNEAIYTAIHEGRREAAEDPRFDHFLSAFPDLRGKSVLDVGCSDGALLGMAQARGASPILGIDIDARAIALAVARGIPARVSTVEELIDGLDGPSFDVILLFDVLEHLVDPVGTLRKLLSVLRPGGRLAVTVPNRERLFAGQVSSDFPPHHFIKFDTRALRATLEAGGFAVDRVEVFQWGYASTVALDLLRRRVLAPFRRVSARTGTSSIRAATRVRSASKERFAEAVFATVRPLSAVVERATGRGFKLFALAHR